MAGHPADVGGAPIDVAFVVVEDVLMGHRRIDEIAAGRMQHALGRAGRARCVKDEQRVLRLHLLDRARGGDALERLVHPHVAARRPADFAAGSLDHQHVLDARRLLQRLVDVGLQRHLAAAAQAFVGGDDNVRLCVLDAPSDRVGREAAEHHRVDGADTGAGEDRIGRLGDHRHVDGDAVAFADAVPIEHVGELVHLLVQLGVGDQLRFVGQVAFPDDRRLVGALRQMAVDAIVGGVGLAVLVPVDRDMVRIPRDVAHLGVRLEPIDALAFLAPEPIRILDRTLVGLLVASLVDPGALCPVRRYAVHLLGHRSLPSAPVKRAYSFAKYAQPRRRFKPPATRLWSYAFGRRDLASDRTIRHSSSLTG